MSTVMAHMVAFYPDRERSLAVARGLIHGGAAYLEIQFPFSDPTADGPTIEHACQLALQAGFTVDAGFDFVREVAAEAREVAELAGRPPIFIMTYASLVYARGVARFIADGAAAGAAGFILPDLPFDRDEGASAAARASGVTVMPVTVTTAPPERTARLLESRPEYLYVALRRGITGTRTELDEPTISFLDRARATGTRVMAGFGISDRDQVVMLEPHAHAAVVGSALVRTVGENASASPQTLEAAIASRVRSLVG